MRYLAIVILTACQFTAFPFLAMVTANTIRHSHQAAHETQSVKQAELPKGTTIYKTVEM